MSSNIEEISHQVTHNVLGAFCYSLLCYLLSVLSLGYLIVFASGVYPPISVNNQNADQPFVVAFFWNVALLMLFGIQHSVMARKGFKQWLLKYLPQSVERATYCLGSALALIAIAKFWMPMSGDVWAIRSASMSIAVQCLGAAGWVLLLVASFQLDHFELFGLRQTWAPLTGRPNPEARFKTPGLYKIVRHPIQLGVLIGLWSVPSSSINHLLLATGMTVYIFVGLYFEERDLIRDFGNTYRDYKKRVAKVVPFIF